MQISISEYLESIQEQLKSKEKEYSIVERDAFEKWKETKTDEAWDEWSKAYGELGEVSRTYESVIGLLIKISRLSRIGIKIGA